MSNLEVTIYLRPDGRKLRTMITKVDPEDAKFFKRHNIIISIEELDDKLEDRQYALYGRYPDQDEEDELIVLSNGRTCNECLNELRTSLEAQL